MTRPEPTLDRIARALSVLDALERLRTVRGLRLTEHEGDYLADCHDAAVCMATPEAALIELAAEVGR